MAQTLEMPVTQQSHVTKRQRLFVRLLVAICLFLLMVTSFLVAHTVQGQVMKNDVNKVSSDVSEVSADVSEVSADLEIIRKILILSWLNTSLPSCRHYRMRGLPSGVYDIDPQDGQPAFPAFCDMDTADGPWLVFQRRKDGSVNFTRNWADYESGFGDMRNEFWLGLEKLHRLTSAGLTQLRVDMASWDARTAYARYSSFQVANSSEFYRLAVHSYSGTAGDNIYYFNRRDLTADGMQFSTYDGGKDGYEANKCATGYKAGWWYNKCHRANPNGIYGSQGDVGWQYVAWPSFDSTDDDGFKSLKFMEMKIK